MRLPRALEHAKNSSSPFGYFLRVISGRLPSAAASMQSALTGSRRLANAPRSQIWKESPGNFLCICRNLAFYLRSTRKSSELSSPPSACWLRVCSLQCRIGHLSRLGLPPCKTCVPDQLSTLQEYTPPFRNTMWVSFPYVFPISTILGCPSDVDPCGKGQGDHIRMHTIYTPSQ